MQTDKDYPSDHDDYAYVAVFKWGCEMTKVVPSVHITETIFCLSGDTSVCSLLVLDQRSTSMNGGLLEGFENSLVPNGVNSKPPRGR